MFENKVNLEITFGEIPASVTVNINEKKSKLKNLQWWLFCKVFPCTYRWIEEVNK